jgi:hypothetical protein
MWWLTPALFVETDVVAHPVGIGLQECGIHKIIHVVEVVIGGTTGQDGAFEDIVDMEAGQPALLE